jgi:hypothetical protein
MPRLTKQSHLECLLKETHRLAIHSPGLRTVMNDTQIGSYSLKKGSLVTEERESSHGSQPHPPTLLFYVGS